MYTRARGRKPWIDCITMMHGKQMYGKSSNTVLIVALILLEFVFTILIVAREGTDPPAVMRFIGKINLYEAY